MTQPPRRLGMYVEPRGPHHGRDQLALYEDLGLHTAWVGDSLGDWRAPDQPLLDAWPALGAYAQATTRIELGMLITNLSWRRPVELARWAMTIDQLSGGRFALGLGCGPLDDQVMMGDAVAAMSPRERVDRLAEATQVIDRLLRGDVSRFDGTYTSYERAAIAPGCVQQPRLPLTIAGNGRRVVTLAAAHADRWNTYVDTATVEDFVDPTKRRLELFDAHLIESGRDPKSVTRSILAFDEAFDAWQTPGAITTFVETFEPLGFTEFVFHPPAGDLGPIKTFGRNELPDLLA